MEAQDYYKRIKSFNYKLTPKRKAIVNLFLENRQYFSVQEIWNKLHNDFDKLGIPTIYRILQQFAEINIADSIIMEENRIFYFLCDCSRNNHHYFICKKCKSVFSLDFCAAKEMESAVSEQLAGKISDHKLTIEGLCRNCKERGYENECS